MVKAAALLFDRVHVTTRETPQDNDAFADVPEEFTFCVLKASWNALATLQKKHAGLEFAAWQAKFHQYLLAQYDFLGIHVVPSYDTDDSFRREFPDGKSVAYQAALNNLPIVENDKLSWDQVVGFRNDKEAKSRFRALRGWFREGFNTDSLPEATDRIAKRIEDYEWAIRKHGMQTRNGAISEILKLESVGAAIASGSAATVVGGSTMGALVSGLSLVAKCCLWFRERRLDLETIKKEQFAEVAILHETRELLESHK